MKNLIVLLSLSLALLAISCQSESSSSSNVEPAVASVSLSPEEEKGQEILDKCIAAHGGLAQWNKFEGLEYKLINNGKPLYQLTHLKDRRAYIKAEAFEIGFDGSTAWAFPDASKVPAKSAAFYYNLDFYFIGIPFVLKDEGVSATYAGKTTVDDKAYEALKITFGSEIGFTPEDVYYMYIDPESYVLEILTYSVTFFEDSNGAINTAKFYSDYKEIQGLLMPGKMENFKWEEGDLGESSNHLRVFENIRFFDKIPDVKKFEVPEGAVLEKVVN